MPSKIAEIVKALDWKDYLGLSVLFVLVVAVFLPERLADLLEAVERVFAAIANVIPGVSL